MTLDKEAAAKCSCDGGLIDTHFGGMTRPCPHCQRQFYTPRKPREKPLNAAGDANGS